MSRIQQTFERLNERKALIPFITAGDPQPAFTVPLMHALVDAGANIIELGVPFSDPMADGPVIQAADERALAHHVGLNDVLAMVKTFRDKDSETPIVLMGYLNPVEIMGYTAFAKACSEAGVDGVLLVDMPPEEADELTAVMREQGVDIIYLISPTTDEQRIRKINEVASGYLYYVSLKGVTGANTLDVDSVASKLEQIRSITDLPVGVGFGIKDGETAHAVAKIADAVVVGSALVKQIAENPDNEQLIQQRISAIVSDMRNKMDS